MFISFFFNETTMENLIVDIFKTSKHLFLGVFCYEDHSFPSCFYVQRIKFVLIYKFYMFVSVYTKIVSYFPKYKIIHISGKIFNRLYQFLLFLKVSSFRSQYFFAQNKINPNFLLSYAE